MSAITLTGHDELPPADAAIVDAGLGGFNDAAAPLHEVRPMSCFARTPDGAVLGGAVGRTWGPAAEIQQQRRKAMRDAPHLHRCPPWPPGA